MRFIVLLLSLFPALMFLWSCQSAPSNLMPEKDPNSMARQKIRSLTDQTLVALATHNVDQLQKFLSPDDQQDSNLQITRLLLGPQTAAWIIERWDAQTIRITIHENQLQATASGFVLCKPKPNRKLIKSRFMFHFSRAALQDPWALVLSRP